MSVIYTNQLQVLIDCTLWLRLFKKQPLDLAILPSVAAQRWIWFVDNWPTIYPKFKALAAGNGTYEASLKDFDAAVRSYKLGNGLNPLQSSDKIADFWFFLSVTGTEGLVLTPDEQVLIGLERQRVSKFSIETFRDMLRFLREDAAARAGFVGLGDADAARIVGVQVTQRQRNATVSDLDLMGDINQFYKFVESIAYLYKRSVDKPPNLLAIANQNVTADSDVGFSTAYLSYFPMPFEISLESMAKKYLGDARRWFELVTVNNLQPPYIDEAGTKYPLLAPGAANNLIIGSNQKDDVNVGTRIMIGSQKVKEEARIVEKITYNNDNTMVLFLSGAQDLTKLKVAEAAFVRVYLPHTVSTGSFILIPSIFPGANLPSTTPQSDELRRLDKSLLQFGVDLARTQTGDLAIDANGNLSLAAGMANIRQAVLYHLRTTVGDLDWHPSFGINAAIGGRYYGTRDEVVIFAQILREAIMTDPRFKEVMVQNIQATNTGMAITFLVKINDLNTPIPLSFVS